MAGRQWRHLLLPLPGLSVDQEYHPSPGTGASTTLVGIYQGEEHEAVADPPDGFRVLAMTRAARYPVEKLMRRCRYARWRGVLTTVLAVAGTWVRLRLCRPDPASVAALGAQCYERGVYEVWAPATDITDTREANLHYPL